MYYNRNAAINQFLHMLFCTRRESKLCLTGKMEKCIIPSIDKDTHGFDGQKEHPYILKGLENTQSILCGLFIVWLPFCSVKTASHLTGGESIMEFSPQGGNGMARTSLLPRPPSKAQRSGFARKKEEGESIMEFSPQGGNGMARTSSDAVRRMCSCLPRVIRFIIYSAAARNNSQHNYQRRGGVEWQSPAEVKN